uniref:AGC-kinase C-terminal domain-containing protein n=1 Tax=Gongylonema pulchrum TaxID=637853 RepID=A0A183EQS2_9BILA
LKHVCLNDVKREEFKGFEDLDTDAMDLMGSLRQHGDMSDDDNDDAIVPFDFMNSVQERLESKL